MGTIAPASKEIRMRLPILAAAFIVSTPALAAEMPARKPGLWELKMVMDGGPMPAQTFQHCIARRPIRR
jgi:hypothetical protein